MAGGGFADSKTCKTKTHAEKGGATFWMGKGGTLASGHVLNVKGYSYAEVMVRGEKKQKPATVTIIKIHAGLHLDSKRHRAQGEPYNLLRIPAGSARRIQHVADRSCILPSP